MDRLGVFSMRRRLPGFDFNLDEVRSRVLSRLHTTHGS